MAAYGVLGATSWGVTLASLLCANGHDVSLLVRGAAEAAFVGSKRGIARLPHVRLAEAITIVPASDAAPGEGLVVATPAQRLRAAVMPLDAWRAVPVLSVAKGIETETGLRMTEVLAASGWAPALLAALSGPNLAPEVARGLPAAAVVAAHDGTLAAAWQASLSGGAFRVYRSSDLAGVELCGATKNVIAIAAGAAAGLGFGANTIAAILTRGLAEMTRLGVALRARPETFMGLAGMGDLAATCYSPLSRNRRFGEALARGVPAAHAARDIGETVEGAATAPVVLRLARAHGVDVPITEQVCAVLAGADVRAAMSELLARGLTAESGPRA